MHDHDDDEHSLFEGEHGLMSMAEYLAEFQSKRKAPEDDIAELVACLPTSVCLRMLQGAKTRAEGLRSERNRREALEHAEAKVRDWEARVAVAYERDAQVAERQKLGPEYARCFCLGQGGAGDLMTAGMPSGRGDTLAAVVDGQPVQVWERVCSCPEGEKHRLSVREKVNQALAALRAKRVARIAGEAKIPQIYTDLTVLSWSQAATEAGGEPEEIEQVLSAVGRWQDHCQEMLRREPVALNESGRPGLRVVPRLLYLFGNHGTGKSGLAAAIAWRWIEQEHSVLYRTVTQMSAELRASPYRHQRNEEGELPTEYELLTAFTDVDLLVIDDLGSESASFTNLDKAREALFFILDARLAACRPTIVTTNLTQEQLAERYGARIVDRLVMPQVAVLAGLVTPNLRGSAGY